MYFDSLVLSGGGSKGIAQLGAINYYMTCGKYNNDFIKEYSGTSVGSIICLLLNCGFDPVSNIFTNLYNSDNFLDSIKISNNFSIFNLLKDYGLIDIGMVIKIVSDMIMKKYGKIPTLLELHQLSEKKLTITVTNETKSKSEYLSFENYPDLSVIKAVSMSCSIPLIFKRIKHGNDYYIDGGLVDNYPVRGISFHCKNTLGIVLLEKPSNNGIDNIINYLYKLSSLPIHSLTEASSMTNNPNIETLVIRLENISLFDFNPDKEKKMKLLALGYSFAELYDSRKYMTIYIDSHNSNYISDSHILDQSRIDSREILESKSLEKSETCDSLNPLELNELEKSESEKNWDLDSLEISLEIDKI